MRETTLVSRALLAAVLCFIVAAHAQNPQQGSGKRELIYCADQMTHEEREAYRKKMRAAGTDEEKAAIRQTHQQEMQARARQRGGEALCEPLRLRLRHGGGQ